MPETSFMDTSFWLTALGILCLLVMSAFFSGSETALTASSRGKLKQLADKGSSGAAAAMHVTDDSERMIGALLLGNNIVNILSASLATALLTKAFGDSGVAVATAVMTVLVLVFGEVMPKTLAITFPEAVAQRVAPVIRVLIVLFSPIVTLVRALVRLLLRLVGVWADPDSKILALREEIVGAISLGHSEGAMQKEDRDRLLGALDLGERTVDEIMKHRRQIELIARANFAAQTQTHVAALDLMEARNHSDLARRLDAAAQGRFGLAGAAIALERPGGVPFGWRGLDAGEVDRLLGDHGLSWLGPMFDGLDLFGAAGDQVKSVALVRMAPHLTPGEPPRACICAFGSPEEDGFTPTMGCELVAFIARVVERTAERWPILN